MAIGRIPRQLPPVAPGRLDRPQAKAAASIQKPPPAKPPQPEVAIVIGDGFAWNEALLAYNEFAKSGAKVTFYTPDGKVPTPDPMNTRDASQVQPFWMRPIMRLYADVPDASQSPASPDGQRMSAALQQARPISGMDAGKTDILYVVGGFGAPVSLEKPEVHQKIREVFDRGAVVSGVCHGTGVIANTPGADGRSIASGRRFSGTQPWAESMMRKIQVSDPRYLAQPLNSEVLRENGVLENPLKELVPGDVEADGPFVTGMGPASAGNVAKQALALFRKSRAAPAT